MNLRRRAQVAAGTAAALLGAVVLGVLVPAPPASAHTISGIGSTNWVTAVNSVQPSPPGLRVRSIQLGNLIEIDNTGPEIVVLGYQDEPYLRIGPSGVWQNLRSPATYINQTRSGVTTIPFDASDNPSTPPHWQKVSDSHTAAYHDHRTHWMAPSPPPPVAADPGRVHRLAPWTIHLRQGMTPVTVTGSLTWVPGPSIWPWLLAAGALCALTVTLLVSRHRRLWLGAALFVLTVVDVFHTVGIAATVTGGPSTHLARWATSSFYSFPAWLFAGLAIWRLQRRGNEGLVASLYAGLSVFMLTGLADINTLHRSGAPFAWGIQTDRVTVAVGLGLGLGVAMASALWWHRRPPLATDDDPQGALSAAPAQPWPRLRVVPDPPEPGRSF